MKHQLMPIEQPFSNEVETVLSNYPKGPNGYILNLFRVFVLDYEIMHQYISNACIESTLKFIKLINIIFMHILF